MPSFSESAALNAALSAATRAGRAVLDIYHSDFRVEEKADRSPLSEADLASHRIITDTLTAASPLPILSEESDETCHTIRSGWSRFWLVDPLDGTKEFVKRNGEFTINVALIEGAAPILGVVYAPDRDSVYFASASLGAYWCKFPPDAEFRTVDRLLGQSDPLPRSTPSSGMTVVASRSHSNSETEAFIDSIERRFGDAERVSIGSSLKLCLVAEGTADVYPRLAPTMEWDTAAADAVVRASGGEVVDAESGAPLAYNKSSLYNPHFIVRSRAMKSRPDKLP